MNNQFPHASPDQYFWAANGTIIRNIPELADALEGMDPYHFQPHVNEQKNDFSTWITSTLGDGALATQLQGKDQKEHQIILLKHMINAMR